MEITKGMDKVRAEGGDMSVFLARPKQGGPLPAIIVVMEAFGLNDHIKNVASRIAAEGYVVAAPDVYYRETNAVVGYDQLPEAIRLMTDLWDSKILQDMGAVISFLQKQKDAKADKIGMTGFCMGGRITFLTACNNSAIKASVPFYGGGIAAVMQASDRTPIAPLEYADKLQAPMLLFFGERDAFIPLDHVNKIKSRLADLGKKAEVVVYPGADHGFFCDERASYNADAAKDAWKRMTDFFARHLRD
jgi:carboxymethylenebutenolidase